MPIVSLHDDQTLDEYGKPTVRVFQLVFAHELSLDPERWQNADSASLAGGPFTLSMCQQIEEQAERLFYLESAVAEAKDYARMCRDVALSQDLQEVAHAMQIILDSLTPEQATPNPPANEG